MVLESFWAYGWVRAALIAYFVIPRYGWRVAFFLGALPAFYVFVLRRAIPESPRFLFSKGRASEAIAVIRTVEMASEIMPTNETVQQRQPANFVQPGEEGTFQRFLELWSRSNLRRTVMLWVLWFTIVFSYYGIFTWLPTLLAEGGRSLTKSFAYVLIITIAQIPGYFMPLISWTGWGASGRWPPIYS